MALIEGRSLADRLAEEGPLSPGHAAGVAAELAEALAYAHALGVVHRDVKPANVRVDHRGDVYLMDFGIAYRPDSNELPLPPGTILGTPAYVAPEQAEGGGGPTPCPPAINTAWARSSTSCSAAGRRSSGRRRMSCSTRSTASRPRPAPSSPGSRAPWRPSA